MYAEKRYPIYEVEREGERNQRIKSQVGFAVVTVEGTIEADDERGTEALPEVENPTPPSVPRYPAAQVK